MSGPDEKTAQIDAFLRGEMTPADRGAFEREMLKDPALRAEVELERRIDERLRAIYAPPAMATVPARVRVPTARPWTRIAMGMAAAIALVAAGVYFTVLRVPGPGGTRADVILASMERNGFEPVWECKDDEEFRRYTQEKFGQAFTVAQDANVRVVGWHYCTGVLSDDAGVMLVELGGSDRAIVVVDRRANDRRVEVDAASGARVHRLRVGDAVLYEVSKRAEPAVLPLVRAAE